MLSTDSSSPAPKRFNKRFGHNKKRGLSIVLSAFLLCIAVGYPLYKVLSKDAGANQTQVKDETVAVGSESELANDQPAETELATEDTATITTYIVQSGDTLSGIASKFGISVNTIRWANDLTEKTSKIKPGDELVILPVSGIEYTVKKGDTLSGIAARYDTDQEDILKYNDVDADAIKVGMSLIIPGAEPVKASTPKQPSKPVATAPKQQATQTAPTKVAQTTTSDDSDEKPETDSGYAVPVSGVLTQGIHDRNAVDFGVPTGTSVKAFKSGVAKSSGYNGGYGSYIVINHAGSCQTQYSHLSKVSVSVGDTVTQGEVIGLSGNTGRSTGPHLHFNVRNCGGNPFTKYKIGTRF